MSVSEPYVFHSGKFDTLFHLETFLLGIESVYGQLFTIFFTILSQIIQSCQLEVLLLYLSIVEIKPCGLGSRIRDMEAESRN